MKQPPVHFASMFVTFKASIGLSLIGRAVMCCGSGYTYEGYNYPPDLWCASSHFRLHTVRDVDTVLQCGSLLLHCGPYTVVLCFRYFQHRSNKWVCPFVPGCVPGCYGSARPWSRLAVTVISVISDLCLFGRTTVPLTLVISYFSPWYHGHKPYIHHLGYCLVS